jgi:homoserine kinase type II
MAVYTHVSAEQIDAFLTDYDVGNLRSFKGIAEGVENSNYLLETDRSRYILTLYEKRVDVADLPFFMALLDHLAANGCKVPCAIADRKGVQIKHLSGRAACLIEFLQGVSLSTPTAAQARAAGVALGELHQAVTDFDQTRDNSMGLASWRPLAEKCAGHWDSIDPGLEKLVHGALDDVEQHWPENLPHSVIHADLFPDNVLMLGDKVTGLIDFYFSCSDLRAYDLAVTHAAWCFSNDGTRFNDAVSKALVAGYRSIIPLDRREVEALPLLCIGAALRFTLSRAYDWINTPADAMVSRKDPMAFARRLEFYRDSGNENIFS